MKLLQIKIDITEGAVLSKPMHLFTLNVHLSCVLIFKKIVQLNCTTNESSIYFNRNFGKVAERDLKKFLKTQIKKKKRTPDFLSPNEIQKLQTINRRKQGTCSIENSCHSTHVF